MKDRGNDFADCFTFRVGPRYGLSAHVQVTDYLGAGLGWARGEMTGFIGRDPVNRREEYTAFIWEHLSMPDQPRATLKTGREAETTRIFVPVGDGLGPRHIFPADFRIEADVTFGIFGFAVGFNPVEFADFAAGIFGTDFAMDDSYWQDDFARLSDHLRYGTPVGKAAAESRIAELNPPGASAALIKILSDKLNDEAFAAILSTVKDLADPTAAGDLKSLLTTASPEHAPDVLEAISALDKGPDFAPFAESVFAACDNTEADLAATALRLLWERNDPASAPHLAALVCRERAAFQYWREALDFVGASGSKEAGKTLSAALAAFDPKSEMDVEFFGAAALAVSETGDDSVCPVP